MPSMSKSTLEPSATTWMRSMASKARSVPEVAPFVMDVRSSRADREPRRGRATRRVAASLAWVSWSRRILRSKLMSCLRYAICCGPGLAPLQGPEAVQVGDHALLAVRRRHGGHGADALGVRRQLAVPVLPEALHLRAGGLDAFRVAGGTLGLGGLA